MSTDSIVIAAARRTPIGSFQGTLSALSAPELAAAASRAALGDAGLDPAELSEVIFGCVLPAGLGQAPARQAALAPAFPTPSAAPPSTRCAARA
jgi:acetyl-CoA C-acetyltransferase